MMLLLPVNNVTQKALLVHKKMLISLKNGSSCKDSSLVRKFTCPMGQLD